MTMVNTNKQKSKKHLETANHRTQVKPRISKFENHKFSKNRRDKRMVVARGRQENRKLLFNRHVTAMKRTLFQPSVVMKVLNSTPRYGELKKC